MNVNYALSRSLVHSRAAFDTAQAAVTAAGEQLTPGRIEDATETASTATWGMLIALLVGFGAAALGGLLGARGNQATQLRTA